MRNIIKKKTTKQKQTMKVFAAALLAYSTYALNLRQEDGTKPPKDGCGPPPENHEDISMDDLFFMIAGEDEMIDEHEARAALGCAVEWGFLTDEEAKEIFKEGEKLAGEDGKLSYHELPDDDFSDHGSDHGSGSGSCSGSGSGSDSESCGPPPEIPEGFTEKDLFHEIAGSDDEIDEREAKWAFGCAVEWGFITKDEADEMFEKGGELAGDDGKLSLEEAGV